MSQLILPTQLSLNGRDWLLKDFYGEDWRWRNSHLLNTRDVRGWRPASVPGSIYDDLRRNGEIPDPHFEMNTRLLEWIPARTWLFKHTFSISEEYRGCVSWLRFEGIDYEAEFFLNGVALGTHRGMYTPAEFNVTTHLNYGGDNLLTVVISHAPDEQPQVGRTSHTHTHKSRMGYWWDFCPRMVQVGIWDRVSLWFTQSVRIIDVFVQPKLNDALNHATVNSTIELESANDADITIESRLTLRDETVATKRETHHATATSTTFNVISEVLSPQLWFPNGYGDQPLYTLDVTISDGAQTLDTRTITFGIRKIEFIANDDAPDDARPYTLVVNGQRVYINGWNWVPQDAMYGLPQLDKLERLLTLAQRAHVNMLRIWGGGLIEKEAFYAHCDRLGLLVWQEFILSSSGIENLPPDDPAFIQQLTHEAVQIIRRKRNHPSLAIWCGGNELQYGFEHPIDEAHPLIAALQTTIQQHDPDRVFLPSSPSGGVFSFDLQNAERDPNALHDVHGPWEHHGLTAHYQLYNTARCLLHSEFGTEGLTNLRTLERTISASNRFPVTLDNPVWHHLAAWWIKERQWRESLGEIADIETLVKGTQLLQAEGVRYAIEAHRRDMYHNSGTLPWQFNEPYPMAACTSAVDYYTHPKPLYYAISRAYEPLQVSASFKSQSWHSETSFEASIWVSNLSATTYPAATIEARLITINGDVFAQQLVIATVPATTAQQVTTILGSLVGVEHAFLLDLTLWANETVVHNQYIFTRMATLAPLFTLPITTLDVQQHDDGLHITNTGDQLALLIWLEDTRPIDADGSMYVSDNYFSLLPNEQRHISIQWLDVAAKDRQLSIRGWNTNNITS
jgi:beta-mannosidase